MRILKSTKQIMASYVAKCFIKMMKNFKNLRQYSKSIKYSGKQKSSFFSAKLSYQISPFCGDLFKSQFFRSLLMPDLN